MVAIETEKGRSADNMATMDWLIPFHHTEHCAPDADKNTQSNKQKEKRERQREGKTLHNSISMIPATPWERGKVKQGK